MTVQEAINRTTDEVRLPPWIQIPEGCVPRIAEIYCERWPHRGYEKGEAYVVWTIVAPFYKYGTYENFTHGEWFDLKDLELVEEKGAVK